MPNVPRGNGHIDFGVLMRRTYRLNRDSARNKAYDYAYRFKQNWESRFGNENMIWGDPTGGAPEPLSEKTFELREKRAEKLGVAMPRDMLDDWTLPHVAEEGQIKDSIEMSGLQELQRGWATDIQYRVSTNHSKFPLNELGIGVPQRMTLEPTKNAIAANFSHDLNDDFKKNTTRIP